MAHGGPSDYSHISEAILEGKADAISLASMLHYEAASSFELDELGEGNLEFLKSKKNYKNFNSDSLTKIKSRLVLDGFNIRP